MSQREGLRVEHVGVYPGGGVPWRGEVRPRGRGNGGNVGGGGYGREGSPGEWGVEEERPVGRVARGRGAP